MQQSVAGSQVRVVTTTSVEALRANNAAPWLIEAMQQLVRGRTTALGGVLHSVGEPYQVDGTRATVRCHFVARDPYGRPRVKALAQQLATRITDYCIPRDRLRDADAIYHETRSSAAFSALESEARSLFADLTTSGEGGELLLYVLLESVLEVPQLLAKMPLKTNENVHYHGVDGVHAKITDDGRLGLYWGESKLHARASSAIDDGFESLAPFLNAPDPDDADRDLLLVRDNLSVANQELAAALLQYFDNENERSQHVRVHGACLVGFDMRSYPTTQDVDEVLAGVSRQLGRWRNRIKDRIGDHALEEIEVEVFCVPFPSVQDFRTALDHQLFGRS